MQRVICILQLWSHASVWTPNRKPIQSWQLLQPIFIEIRRGKLLTRLSLKYLGWCCRSKADETQTNWKVRRLWSCLSSQKQVQQLYRAQQNRVKSVWRNIQKFLHRCASAQADRRVQMRPEQGDLQNWKILSYQSRARTKCHKFGAEQLPWSWAVRAGWVQSCKISDARKARHQAKEAGSR